MTGKALPGIPAAGTAPGAAPVYEIKNLLFSFGRDPVLSIQQLDFEKAKIHVLLGPNGSGKTTLLKILNRLLTGWSGSISFQGSPIAGSEDVRLKTVYLHQSPLLFTGSVYDNVSLGLRMRKLPAAEIREKVAATLGIVGLKDFGKRKALALSGGEAQRVALARALALDPEVLLLDEPTAGVDKHHTGRIENLLRVIKGETGTTIIISTHNLPFAYRVCDRLVHLEEGGTRPLFENILPGTMEQETSYFTLFNSGGILLKCPLSEGTFTRAVLDYDRILLSLKPVETSAQNCLPCIVQSIALCAESRGLRDVDVRISPENTAKGKSAGTDAPQGIVLRTRITEKSLETLSLEPGKRAWVSFKSSSIRLY